MSSLYDANFKLMVVNEAESSNNRKAAKKFGVTECNVRRWRAQKERLKNTNSQRKAFRGPQSGKFAELDDRIYEYVIEKRQDAMPITREIIRLRALELAKELNIPTNEFKASTGWCTRMMRRKGLTLRLHLLCTWILQAWDAISQESIIHGFKKCCISNALDGSEDDILWEVFVEHHDSDDSESELVT
uniref:HTH CENPB-type domain-containing protein n=1 Tax=Sander lucioperca TaxID=283035 RepID=A0A8D0D2D7_SANLU